MEEEGRGLAIEDRFEMLCAHTKSAVGEVQVQLDLAFAFVRVNTFIFIREFGRSR